MLRGSLTLMALLVTGCSGNGAIGTTCGGNADCAGDLQCLNALCQPRCARAPDCGDGFSCNADGECITATKQPGDACESEVDCATGLSCQLDNSRANNDLYLAATCNAQHTTSPAGATCTDDNDCRNGTCSLGHCVDICKDDRDCGEGYNCAVIPSVTVSRALFHGCLPQGGLLSWDLPIDSTTPELLIPAPAIATSLELLMSVDDANQKVGATSVLAPNGTRIYARPCSSVRGDCTPEQEADQFFANAQRHEPGFGQSVLQIPSGNNVAVMTGVYQVEVATQNASDNPGTALPRITALLRLDTGVHLELHMFFLDLSDHPCQAMIGSAPLNAATAPSLDGFQAEYLYELRNIFHDSALTIDTTSFEDVKDHPTLDGLDLANVGDLLKLGKYATGINVFFVRSLSPAGIQGYAPNPGPAGLAGTRQSGIVISVDTLCYRSWTALARLTAHEIARYMGLYHNVELGTDDHATWIDQIDDTSGDPANLMYFAERIGTDAEVPRPKLTSGQRQILSRSPAMQNVAVPQ